MAAVKWIPVQTCRAQDWENLIIQRLLAPAAVPGSLYTLPVHSVSLRLRAFYTGEVADIRAIPKKLLIHSAVYAKTNVEDRWGKETLKDEIKLRFIRLEPSAKIIRDKNGAEVQLAATLFYDCRNSRPQNIEFAVDDIILFNGQKHAVQLVEPLYDGRKLHHYELGMVKHA